MPVKRVGHFIMSNQVTLNVRMEESIKDFSRETLQSTPSLFNHGNISDSSLGSIFDDVIQREATMAQAIQ